MICEKCGSGFFSKKKCARFCSIKCVNLQDLSTRFWSKVKIDQPDECWEWQGRKANTGYGQFWITERGRIYGSHRVAYELAYGQIPPVDHYYGTVIRHKCDNRSCCNPAHLESGTIGDNNRDTVARGRHKRKGGSKKGEDHPGAKLSAEDVKLIREMYIPRKKGYTELGKIFGVDRTTIRLIVKRKKWSHI